MDIFVFKKIVSEINNALCCDRVINIMQSNPQMVLFRFTKNNFLLFSVRPDLSCLYMPEKWNSENSERTHFGQQLERFVLGATLIKCEVIGSDRIGVFHFEKVDKIGVAVRCRLVFEIIGRSCNLILLGEGTESIVDCLKRTDRGKRMLLPAADYVLPNPPPGLFLQNRVALRDVLLENGREFIRLVLLKAVREFAPPIVDEILFRAKVALPGKIEDLSESELEAILYQIDTFASLIENDALRPSVMYTSNDQVLSLSVIPLYHLKAEYQQFPTVNAAANYYYDRIQQQQQENQLQHRLQSAIKKNIRKIETLIDRLKKDLETANRADEYRIMGEILTANLFQVKSGMKEISLANFYEPQQHSITISLDPTLSPQKNAERYFHKYRKARDGQEIIATHLKSVRKQLKYWTSLKAELEHATILDDMIELENKLMNDGKIQSSRSTRSKRKTEPNVIRPHRFTTSEGWSVLVGRNNKENDALTRHMAHKNDIWLHTQGAPGAHVVLCRDGRREINPKALREAAEIAAFYSKSKHSAHVPVIYTERRFVRKPRGSAPGQVACTNERTLFVTPKRPKSGKLSKN